MNNRLAHFLKLANSLNSINKVSMLKNFFVIAVRNLKKNKGYPFLNILGLSAGLTCFAFIVVWVKDELSYDRFNKNADRIVRVAGKVTTEAESFDQAVTSVPM